MTENTVDEESYLEECETVEVQNFKYQYDHRQEDTPTIAAEFIKRSPVKNFKQMKMNKASPKTINPSIYPAILKDTIKKDDGSNLVRIIPLGNKYVSNFSFTKPIIEMKSDGTIIKHYDKFREGDTLHVWQCLDRTGTPMHLTAVILCAEDNTKYSFGFGLKKSTLLDTITIGIQTIDSMLKENFGKAVGVIYTPDGVFENKILYQVNKPDKTYAKLISSVNITAEHIQNIHDAFDQLSFPANIENVNLMISPILSPCGAWNLQEYTNELQRELITNIGFGEKGKDLIQFKEQVVDYLHRIKNDDTVPCHYIYSISYSITHNYVYCKFSSKNTQTSNCSSFIDRIFRDSINCGVLSNYIAVDPKRCTRGKHPIKSCSKTRRLRDITVDIQ